MAISPVSPSRSNAFPQQWIFPACPKAMVFVSILRLSDVTKNKSKPMIDQVELSSFPDRINSMKPGIELLSAVFFALYGSCICLGQQPNIVLIMCDDLGYGDVQCLNPENGKIKTPHIDKLASEGMIFTDAHSGSSVCTPTRYGLLTGRYSWRTRLQAGGSSRLCSCLIAPDRLTVAGLLKRMATPPL